MKKIIGPILIAGAILALSSCCSCRKLSGGGQLTGGTWQLVQLDGRNVNAANDSYTLTFSADNRMAGVGDCNRLTATYASDKSKGTLTFGPVAATRMMCPDQERENIFVNTLGNITSYKVDGKILMLFSDGELKMMLEKRN